ncbi:MAG: hypothetical protein SO471_08330 [Anaerobutyricum hallii]|uniref:hypothetical protein n=1 Tax=Anaerobutyricum hallii TaxID=39488 RepID=UPI002A7F344E|nr:hypothetical protein [Anaerobutyricum hallii]MDY4577958.1 hypothetical protein [Anaerobutyricum hallii]
MANIIHIGGSSDDARINELSTNVENTYLKKTDAANTYLTQTSAADINFAFVASEKEPTNKKVFWIDTGHNNLLKYYDGAQWVSISAAWG